jgi:hypothetical protein
MTDGDSKPQGTPGHKVVLAIIALIVAAALLIYFNLFRTYGTPGHKFRAPTPVWIIVAVLVVLALVLLLGSFRFGPHGTPGHKWCEYKNCGCVVSKAMADKGTIYCEHGTHPSDAAGSQPCTCTDPRCPSQLGGRKSGRKPSEYQI